MRRGGGIVVLLSALASSTQASVPATHRYGIVMDAGSSGTRCHIFAYADNGPGSLPDLELEDGNGHWQKKIRPGLSSFASNPAGAAENIASLLKFAATKVPPAQHGGTPVFIRATAGLRLISKAAAKGILESCRGAARASPFLDAESWTSVLKGTDEGVLGWIAANYLWGGFGTDSKVPTLGVVELGGASMQVTFALEEGSAGSVDAELDAHSVDIHVAGRLHTVYTHSYLGYGQEAAAKSAIETRLGDDDMEGDPCYPVGYIDVNEKSGHTLRGGGSFELCLEQIERKLFIDVPVRKATGQGSCIDAKLAAGRCTFRGVYQPPLRGPYIAIENFYYTAQFFKLDGSGEGLPQLEARGAAFCRTPWATLAARYDGEFGLQDYCFSAAFISVLLRHGLSFPSSAVAIGPIEPRRGEFHRALLASSPATEAAIDDQEEEMESNLPAVSLFVSNTVESAKIDWAIGAFIKYHADSAGDWAVYAEYGGEEKRVLRGVDAKAHADRVMANAAVAERIMTQLEKRGGAGGGNREGGASRGAAGQQTTKTKLEGVASRIARARRRMSRGVVSSVPSAFLPDSARGWLVVASATFLIVAAVRSRRTQLRTLLFGRRRDHIAKGVNFNA